MDISKMYLLYFVLVSLLSNALADPTATNRAGCDYEGQWVHSGTVVWEDPECECTQLVCLGYKVELVKKPKPCCKDPETKTIWGNGETISGSTCQETVCKAGKFVSLPRCPRGFKLLSYNGCVGCYNVSSSKMVQPNADAYCQSLGTPEAQSRLVEITSEGEEKALEWYLFETYYKQGVTTYWTGGLGKTYNPPPTPPLQQHLTFLRYFYWPSFPQTSLDSIYNDFCPNQPIQDAELAALQLSYYDYGHYCWCNENPFKKNLAICEICTFEKIYQTNCIHKDKVYADGDVIANVVDVPGPCYELICNKGLTTRIEKPCEQVWQGPNFPPNGPPPQV